MKNKEIHLTEQELYSLIKESVVEVLNEDFRGTVKKIGKGIGNAAATAALGLGLAGATVGTICQGQKCSDPHDRQTQPTEMAYDGEDDGVNQVSDREYNEKELGQFEEDF